MKKELVHHSHDIRVCNRLSGYSDIRKNLSIRIATLHYSISEFDLFEITGLCFSIRRYFSIHRQFAHYSNLSSIPISGYDFQLFIIRVIYITYVTVIYTYMHGNK